MKDYLSSMLKQFQYYKMLGDKTMEQIPEEKLFWQPDQESNSIAIIVKHLHGNMMSRWTNFLTEDGEKEWRDRDGEFEGDIQDKEKLMTIWEEGWSCVFETFDQLTMADLEKIIYIRNMGHTVVEAINRQLAHYAYHIGQLVFIGKLIQQENWTSLSVPKGGSKAYNASKFDKPKRKEHFTDDL